MKALAIGVVLIGTALALRWYQLWLDRGTKREIEDITSLWRRRT